MELLTAATVSESLTSSNKNTWVSSAVDIVGPTLAPCACCCVGGRVRGARCAGRGGGACARAPAVGTPPGRAPHDRSLRARRASRAFIISVKYNRGHADANGTVQNASARFCESNTSKVNESRVQSTTTDGAQRESDLGSKSPHDETIRVRRRSGRFPAPRNIVIIAP